MLKEENKKIKKKRRDHLRYHTQSGYDIHNKMLNKGTALLWVVAFFGGGRGGERRRVCIFLFWFLIFIFLLSKKKPKI